MSIPIGIIGTGTYFPAYIEKAAEISQKTGIPEDIVETKLGLRQRYRAMDVPGESVTDMASKAATKALVMAGVDPSEVGLVVYHGSEFKEHLLWNSAGKIMKNIGATKGYGFEIHAVCAAAPIAMHTVKHLMIGDPRIQYAVLCVGTREHDLINYQNVRSRFMFNFSAGGAAMVLKRDAEKNHILGMAAITDPELAENVVMSQEAEVIGEGPEGVGDMRGRLDVYELEFMGERLGQTSLPNYMACIREAVEESGHTLADIDFLGVTHMKRSFYHDILQEIGLTPAQSVYLEDYGHVQSGDQVISLELGLKEGKIKPGDLVVLAGAGAGYTWSAVAVRWG